MSELGQELATSFASREGGSTAALLTLLEERVASLVARHREARKTIEDLEAELREQEARLLELTRRVSEHDQLRQELRTRISKLIERVAALERAGAPASRAEGPSA